MRKLTKKKMPKKDKMTAEQKRKMTKKIPKRDKMTAEQKKRKMTDTQRITIGYAKNRLHKSNQRLCKESVIHVLPFIWVLRHVCTDDRHLMGGIYSKILR